MSELHYRISQRLNTHRKLLAEAVTARHYELHPELSERYGNRGREKCLQDANYHISYLSEAIAASAPLLFADYLVWAKVMLAGRGISAQDLVTNLECLRAALSQILPVEMSAVACEYVTTALAQLPQLPAEVPTFLAPDAPLAELAAAYMATLLRGERQQASQLVLAAVQQGVSVKDVYLQVFQPAQWELGRLWQMNQISVAQEHYCTAATQLIMSQLYPHIFATEKNGSTMVAACVGGDLHEVGARMVSDFFELEGWETFYLGANVPAQSILQTLSEREVQILGISATMTYHITAVTELIREVRAFEAGQQVKIMVGGYPFNIVPNLWQRVGADASAQNALAAVATAKSLVMKEGDL